MKNLFIVFLGIIPFLGISQDCEVLLAVAQTNLEECDEDRRGLEDLLLDGITNEEVLEYTDSVLSRYRDVKTERDEAVIQKNIEETARIAAEMERDELLQINMTVSARLDSLIQDLSNGNGNIKINNIEVAGSVKPYQLE